MDSQRFDEMTRMIASGATRRRLLRGVAAGAGAIVLAGRGVSAHHKPDHCGKAGQPSKPSKPCCAPLVAGDDGRCGPASCVEGGLSCAAGETCCPGLFCSCIPGSEVCITLGTLGTGACCTADNQCQEINGQQCVDGVCCNPAFPETCVLG